MNATKKAQLGQSRLGRGVALLLIGISLSSHITIACASDGLHSLPKKNRKAVPRTPVLGPKPGKMRRTKTVPLIPLVERPISKWEGVRFVFLPDPSGRDEFVVTGREPGIKLPDDAAPEAPTVGTVLKRKDLANEIAKVVGIEINDPNRTLLADRPDAWTREVTLRLERTGVEVRRTLDGALAPDGNVLQGLVCYEDIAAARQRWLGKTLWFARVELPTVDGSDRRVPKYCAVKVLDVGAGTQLNPVRFHVATKTAVKGQVDVNLTGTNTPEGVNRPFAFSYYFLPYDPQAVYQWDARDWKAIQAQRIHVGMLREHVLFSWGPPHSVNRTRTSTGVREQWVYQWVYQTPKYVYLSNGVVEAIQD